MILVTCTACRLALRVLGDVEEISLLVGERSDFWPSKYTCPRCEGPAKGQPEDALLPSELLPFELRDLSAQELFAALNGLGLPDEQACSAEVVGTLLRETPIRRVRIRDVPGSPRSILEQLELWDGTRLYFGASPAGAIVYRNVPAQSYVEKNRV